MHTDLVTDSFQVVIAHDPRFHTGPAREGAGTFVAGAEFSQGWDAITSDSKESGTAEAVMVT